MGVPCLFHKITGLYCPGCGVTRMIKALLSGNAADAFMYNPYVFITAPVAIIILLRCVFRYLHKGRLDTTRTEEGIVIGLVAGLIVFGVFRNLPVYPWHIY